MKTNSTKGLKVVDMMIVHHRPKMEGVLMVSRQNHPATQTPQKMEGVPIVRRRHHLATQTPQKA